MKKRIAALAVFALAGAAAGIFGSATGAAEAVFGPFTAVADGLRALSLSGNAGDVLTWILYALLSLLPLFGLLPKGRKRGWSDGMFAAAAGYGFLYWYLMANPTLALSSLPINAEGMKDIYRAMLTVILFTLLLGAAALRLTEETGGTDAMLARLRAALFALQAWNLFLAVFAFAMGIRSAVESGASAAGYAALTGACDIAVTAFLLIALESARSLLQGMRGGWFAEGNAPLAEKLSRHSKALLAAAILAQLIQNAAALLAVGRVPNANAALSMPVLEFLLACAMLLLSRFVRDGARLRRENDSFI